MLKLCGQLVLLKQEIQHSVKFDLTKMQKILFFLFYSLFWSNIFFFPLLNSKNNLFVLFPVFSANIFQIFLLKNFKYFGMNFFKYYRKIAATATVVVVEKKQHY